MGWPLDKRRGTLLAATVAGDGQLARAEAGLSRSVADSVGDDARELAGADDKRAALRELARITKPAPRAEALKSPRARALAAAQVPTPLGEAWLAEAPTVRRGYRPSRGIVAAVARARGADEPSTAARDRGEGRELLARATDEDRRRLLDGTSAEEAAAVLALAAHPGRAPAPPSALLDAAAIALGDRRVEALGALVRGARRADARHDRDPIARAGRELTELGLGEVP